jgi:hypothetical protein
VQFAEEMEDDQRGDLPVTTILRDEDPARSIRAASLVMHRSSLRGAEPNWPHHYFQRCEREPVASGV